MSVQICFDVSDNTGNYKCDSPDEKRTSYSMFVINRYVSDDDVATADWYVSYDEEKKDYHSMFGNHSSATVTGNRKCDSPDEEVISYSISSPRVIQHLLSKQVRSKWWYCQYRYVTNDEDKTTPLCMATRFW